MDYKCDFCNYSTKIKTHFNRHLNTRKHKINIYNYRLKNRCNEQLLLITNKKKLLIL